MSSKKQDASGVRIAAATAAPAGGVNNAVDAAQRYPPSLQHADGHCWGELEGDTILESEYLLTLPLLGGIGEERAHKGAEYPRRRQLPGGGWAIYEGGPA